MPEPETIWRFLLPLVTLKLWEPLVTVAKMVPDEILLLSTAPLASSLDPTTPERSWMFRVLYVPETVASDEEDAPKEELALRGAAPLTVFTLSWLSSEVPEGTT